MTPCSSHSFKVWVHRIYRVGLLPQTHAQSDLQSWVKLCEYDIQGREGRYLSIVYSSEKLSRYDLILISRKVSWKVARIVLFVFRIVQTDETALRWEWEGVYPNLRHPAGTGHLRPGRGGRENMSGGIYLHHIVDSGLFSVEEINNLLSVNVLENILGTNSSGTRSYSQPVAAHVSTFHTISLRMFLLFHWRGAHTPHWSHKTNLSGNLSYSFEMCWSNP